MDTKTSALPKGTHVVFLTDIYCCGLKCAKAGEGGVTQGKEWRYDEDSELVSLNNRPAKEVYVKKDQFTVNPLNSMMIALTNLVPGAKVQ